MAADALEIDEDDMDDFDTKKAVIAKVIRSHSDKLNDLILEDYAVVLREQYDAPKRQILEHIKLELQGPYRDRRQEYKKYNTNQIFSMISGETDDTLKEGYIVPVIVTKIRGKWANCRLDSGIDGAISIENVSDRRLMSIDEVLNVGQTLDAKVLRIDRERYHVDLSCKESDMAHGDVSLRKLPDDEFYSREEEEKLKKQQNNTRKRVAKTSRMIKHPLFHQLNHREAEEYLEFRQRGDLVIRPSSKGNDHIAITWKVADGVYQHVDVLELEKENDYALGNKLQIGDQTFEDLDELIVTYVEAIAKKVDELMAHHKYKAGGLPKLCKYQGHVGRGL
jgi:transcription elongation factor SPT6